MKEVESDSRVRLRFQNGGQLCAARYESHGDRIDAVTRVFGRHPLTLENVPQMPAAIVADDLGSVSVGVRVLIHGTSHRIVKTGPAAMAIEFIIRLIKRRIATTANERSR